MDELQRALSGLGLSWADVWKLAADRREKTLTVVTLDGRKFTGPLAAAGNRDSATAVRRVRAVKERN